jgi:cytoskeletal protein RodZ
VTNEELRQIDAFTTPGTLLKAARVAEGMSEREAADRLNLMPTYVAILEQDDYEALRSPPFARGYVRAYGRLLGIDEPELLALFDELAASAPGRERKRIETRPLQLQHTGLGIVVGIGVLLLLVCVLWWWQGGREEQGQLSSNPEIEFEPSQRSTGAEE